MSRAHALFFEELPALSRCENRDR